MADKEFPLSIVLRTVDKATAGINAINAKLDRLTRPTREFGKAIGDLAEKSGLKAVGEGFAGIGGAVKDLAGKMLVIGGVAAGAVVAFAGVVGSFDDLGDKAEALGVSVDFLASMRDAAERSGSSMEELDSGVASLSMNMGLLRAGTGKMTGFLKVVSPVLLTQLKATKSNEEAFLLLADAMAKIEDPAKRAAFAQKTLGDASLAPLLARNSKGIKELQKHYTELAGSQEDAVNAAGEVDESMHNLTAATAGVKAALVAGLAPALKIVVDKLTEWLRGHREDIKRWADDIGKKLPAAIDGVVSAVSSAVGDVAKFVDSIGGIKTVALGLAAILVGPLVSAVYALGVALLTTPVGWIVAGIAAIAAGAYLLITRWDDVSGFFVGVWDAITEKFGVAVDVIMLALTPIIGLPLLIIKNWDVLSGFFVDLWDGITGVFTKAWDIIKIIVDKVVGAVDTVTGAIGSAIDFINPFSDVTSFADIAKQRSIDVGTIDAAAGAGGARRTETLVKVDFANAPRGTRVAADPHSTANVDLSVGYQMLGAGL